MWGGGVNGQSVCPWEARDILGSLCRCWLGCAAGSPASYSPKIRKCTSLPSALLQLFCPYPVFAWCQPSHLFLQQFPFHKSPLALVLETWQHLLYVGQHAHPQTSFSSMNVFKRTENVPSWESISATNEGVLRVCLGQEPCVLALFLYFCTSPAFGTHERRVIGLNKLNIWCVPVQLILLWREGTYYKGS